MAANTTPVYPLTPGQVWGTVLTSANTAYDGTGTVDTIATGTTNGKRIKSVILNAAGTNVATLARFFINNGSANSSATNNWLFKEVTLPATTASSTALVTPGGGIEVPMNFTLANGYKLNWCIATAVSAGWKAGILESGDI